MDSLRLEVRHRSLLLDRREFVFITEEGVEVEKTDTEGVVRHVERHVGRHLRAGVSLAQRQALMRHSDPKLTAGVYTRLEAADAIAAVSRIDPAAVTKLYVTSRSSAHPGASAALDEPRSDPA